MTGRPALRVFIAIRDSRIMEQQEKIKYLRIEIQELEDLVRSTRFLLDELDVTASMKTYVEFQRRRTELLQERKLNSYKLQLESAEAWLSCLVHGKAC